MNLGDPDLELLDPTPNVHALFIHFDKVFFWAKLASRAVVRWSKRMYSCAGICSYEGRAGLCDIALSEPLLKLRPRKDLIETLLHEMIHAYLFITNRDRERDGHGPNFQAHMHRINKSAGLNISIYHDFHDEVKLYLTHWWRCNGPCQTRKPYFGIVRRSQNRAPGPSDYWWSTHNKICGGTFVKIKEPEKKTKKTAASKNTKKIGDITKFIKTKSVNGPNDIRKPLTPLVKNITTVPTIKTKSNGGNTVVVTKKNIYESPIKNITKTPIPVFNGNGKPVSGIRRKSIDITEAVRNAWANKQLPGFSDTNISNLITGKALTKNNKEVKPSNKHKAESTHSESPLKKMKKLDDYFKNTATNMLKDVYGQDFKLTQCDNKIIAVGENNTTAINKNTVDCPICGIKVDINNINRHIDECLNKDIIEKLSKDNLETDNTSTIKTEPVVDKTALKNIVGTIPAIPFFKNDVCSYPMFKEENGVIKANIDSKPAKDLINMNISYTRKSIIKNDSMTNSFKPNDKIISEFKEITYDKHMKSGNFVVPKTVAKEINSECLPTFLDDMQTTIEAPVIKIEPGTSKGTVSTFTELKCPCCGNNIDKPMAEHLDECLAFFHNNTTIPEEVPSTSFVNDIIVIDDDDDDDDMFDETMTLNATGTKTPCPCCMEMIELSDMNEHLDSCLS